jgi:hypothetical protein
MEHEIDVGNVFKPRLLIDTRVIAGFNYLPNLRQEIWVEVVQHRAFRNPQITQITPILLFYLCNLWIALPLFVLHRLG